MSENEKKPETIINEFPTFKYEIIGDLKGFSGNEIGKKDIVFIKVNNCGDSELKYLQNNDEAALLAVQLVELFAVVLTLKESLKITTQQKQDLDYKIYE
jgi:hypothetical protein